MDTNGANPKFEARNPNLNRRPRRDRSLTTDACGGLRGKLLTADERGLTQVFEQEETGSGEMNHAMG
jgi:hypothetical protein